MIQYIKIHKNHVTFEYLLYFRHDWYQTESHVAVIIMVKNAKKEDVTVCFGEREVMFMLFFMSLMYSSC